MARDIQWEIGQKILGLKPGPLEAILPAGKLTAEEALAVYESGYRIRLKESLQETFGATCLCLGGEIFDSIAIEFIKKYPSRFYSLSHYGETWPQFLRDQKQLADYPFLCDLANFEWQFCELFHAALDSSEPYDLSQAGDDFNLRLVDHIRLFQSRYSLLNLWNAYVRDAEQMPKWDEPQNFILYRHGNDLRTRQLTLSEFYLLHYLQQSKPISVCVDNLTTLGLKIDEEAIGNLFSFLAVEGLIKSLTAKCIAE